MRCLLSGALTLFDEESAAGELESPATLLARREFAGYELLGEIARGGMGVVFRARQKNPGRIVALKVIAAGELASPRMIERFRTEATAAARLDHPHIVPIYEVGHHGGWHFFSMRLIQGGTLAEKLGGQGMLPEDAAALMLKIARAVQHAHERGVLHRDLKPNNILLDERGEPHLTDFGLAKMLEGSVEMTLSNAVLGTPAYMAPEQAAGGTRDVTVSVDVYGLGAVFYEMLTGRPPFQATTTHALLRAVAEEDPAPPSRLMRGAGRSDGDRGDARPRYTEDVAADLDAICLKCLEKDPRLRYHSAEQLADDLDRALQRQPILAQPSSPTLRVRKWMRRNPAKAGLVFTALASFLLLTLISLAFNLRLTRARNHAVASEADARHELASHLLHENGRRNSADDALMGLLPLLEASRLPGLDPAAERRIDQRLIASLHFSPRLVRLWDAGAAPVSLQFSRDGRRLVAVLRSGAPRAWDLATSEPIRRPVHSSIASTNGRSDLHRGSVISPDGSRVLELMQAPPYAHLWNLADATTTPVAITSRGGDVAAFSPDGEIIATGGTVARLWNTSTGAELRPLTNASFCRWLVFSPDGKELITGHGNDTAWRWDVATGRRLDDTPIAFSSEVAPRFSMDGKQWLITVTGRVHVLNWPTLDLVSSVPAGRLLYEMAWNPDGRQFATAGFFDHARVWDAATGQPFRLPITHESGANKIAFSPDGALLATAGFDYQVRIVRAADHRLYAPAIHHPALIESLAFSRDGRFLAVGDAEGVVQVWDLRSAAQPFAPTGHLARHIAFTGDGKQMVMETVPGSLHRFDLATGALTSNAAPKAPQLPHLSPFPSDFSKGRLHWSRDGRWVAHAGETALHLWNARTGTAVGDVIRSNPGTTISDMSFSPDGHRLAVSFSNPSIEPAVAQILELPSLKPAASLRHGDGVFAVAFSGDGALVATAGEDNVARIWRVSDGKPVTGPLRHRGIVFDVLFSPDGSLLATGSADGNVRFWDVERGELISAPVPLGGAARPLAFAPDGMTLYASVTSSSGRETLWTVASRQQSFPPDQLRARIECLTGLAAEPPGATPLSAAELVQRFGTWNKTGAPLASADDMLQWHTAESLAAEARGAWFTARFHLMQLHAFRPDDPLLKKRLADAQSELSASLR